MSSNTRMRLTVLTLFLVSNSAHGYRRYYKFRSDLDNPAWTPQQSGPPDESRLEKLSNPFEYKPSSSHGAANPGGSGRYGLESDDFISVGIETDEDRESLGTTLVQDHRRSPGEISGNTKRLVIFPNERGRQALPLQQQSPEANMDAIQEKSGLIR